MDSILELDHYNWRNAIPHPKVKGALLQIVYASTEPFDAKLFDFPSHVVPHYLTVLSAATAVIAGVGLDAPAERISKRHLHHFNDANTAWAQTLMVLQSCYFALCGYSPYFISAAGHWGVSAKKDVPFSHPASPLHLFTIGLFADIILTDLLPNLPDEETILSPSKADLNLASSSVKLDCEWALKVFSDDLSPFRNMIIIPPLSETLQPVP